MRKRMWSAAAVIAIAIVVSPTVRAADTRVAMGSSDDPLAFAPADVTVPVGGSVEWFNDTDLEHDVKAEDGSFGSDLLGKGGKYEFRFSKAGTFKYFCTPHKSTGMVGTVTVAGSAPAPTTPTPTPTTAAPAGGATTTTARGASTTTTTRAGAGASAGPTTTTTAGLGVTSTTQAASTTPTSAPESGDVTTTTTTAAGTDGHGGEESAAETHGSEGGSDKKTNPVLVGLAGILTAVLAAVSLKLLTAKP